MHESGFGRVIGALVSPEKTFRSIGERPTWVVPLLLLVLISAGVGYALGQRVDHEEMFRQQMADRDEQVTEEQVQQTAEFMEKFGTVVYAGSAIVSPLIYLLIAVIFMVALRLAGSEIDFGRSFAVTVHSMMPWVVHQLLSLPLLLRLETVEPEVMERGGVLVSNLAPLASEDAGPVLVGLLGSIDLFTVWTLILLTIGYRVVARVSTMTAALAALTLWLIYLAGKLGIAAAFS